MIYVHIFISRQNVGTIYHGLHAQSPLHLTYNFPRAKHPRLVSDLFGSLGSCKAAPLLQQILNAIIVIIVIIINKSSTSNIRPYISLCAFCRVVVPNKPFTNTATALYYKMLLESEPTPLATKCSMQ